MATLPWRITNVLATAPYAAYVILIRLHNPASLGPTEPSYHSCHACENVAALTCECEVETITPHISCFVLLCDTHVDPDTMGPSESCHV